MRASSVKHPRTTSNSNPSTSSTTSSSNSSITMPGSCNGASTTKTNPHCIKKVLRTADAVCFDVDSTICTDEAIDELATHCGVGKEVAELTKSAMSKKDVEFKDALRARLEVMKPSREVLQEYIRKHPPKLTAGIKELVKELHNQGTHVYIVTGGFFTIVEEVAKELGVNTDNIFANKILYYYDGSYAGFDESQHTCRSGGKGRVIKMLKEKHNYKNVIMIGDGATDLEACPPADHFIGFGGNQERARVKQEAQWYIHNFKELTNALQQAAA